MVGTQQQTAARERTGRGGGRAVKARGEELRQRVGRRSEQLVAETGERVGERSSRGIGPRVRRSLHAEDARGSRGGGGLARASEQRERLRVVVVAMVGTTKKPSTAPAAVVWHMAARAG